MQNVLRNTDIAELLLVSKSFVLECWPAEEFALENGRLVSTKTCLHTFESPFVWPCHISTSCVIHARLVCLTGKVKKKSARSLLNGALVRLAATQQLVQITFGTKTRRGHRELEVQVSFSSLAHALLLVFCNLGPYMTNYHYMQASLMCDLL